MHLSLVQKTTVALVAAAAFLMAATFASAQTVTPTTSPTTMPAGAPNTGYGN